MKALINSPWLNWQLINIVKAVLDIASPTWRRPTSRGRLRSLQFLTGTKRVQSGHAYQTLRRFAEAHPYFSFHSCNLDQMDPCRDSAEISISSSVSDSLSFFTFRTSAESLLKRWPTTVPQRHKLTSQSEAPCGQLWPPRVATSHTKACDVLRPRKDSAKIWRSPVEVAENTPPSDFVLYQERALKGLSVSHDLLADLWQVVPDLPLPV